MADAIGFTDEEMAALDALLVSAEAGLGKKVKAAVGKTAFKQSEVAKETRESPVAVGLILRTERRVCKCCKEAEVFVLGELVKYKYRGGVIKKPYSPVTQVDYERMVEGGVGSREIEVEGNTYIEQCSKCSAVSLERWGARNPEGIEKTGEGR